MAEVRMTRDFFLWGMAAIYLFAFASLYVQIPGLWGNNGILPARLAILSDVEGVWELLSSDQPSLLRLLHHLGVDTASGLDLLSLSGLILAFLALVSHNLRNCLIFTLLWMFYLSIFLVGGTFLWFQWDTLLLEAGFLTALLAPVNLVGGASYHQHDRVLLGLVRWLLFRLMFASGVVKLTSLCPTWWALTALNYHYETQCLATPLAWYFHQLPAWFHALSVVVVYVIEIALPFLFFSPVRSQRLFSFWAQISLMALILVTGNYNFFNLLTCVLCISLLDDDFLAACIRRRPPPASRDRPTLLHSVCRPLKWTCNVLVYGGLLYWTVRLFSLTPGTNRVTSKIVFSADDLSAFLVRVVPLTVWLGLVFIVGLIISALYRSVASERGPLRKTVNVLGCLVFGSAALGMFGLSLVRYTSLEQGVQSRLWPELHRWHRASHAYSLTSSYGLFRRMTGVGGRPEVIIEGSHDRTRGWREYDFLHKPGNLSWQPTVVAPHQPRLDWQMWFAALGSYDHNPWFLNLVYRLLKNTPEVLELMGPTPFPGQAPTFVRAKLYHYYFTSYSDQNNGSDWWRRTYQRDYISPVSLQDSKFFNYAVNAGITQVVEPQDVPNPLVRLLHWVRSVVAQPDGFSFCLGLFISAATLCILDPGIRGLQSVH